MENGLEKKTSGASAEAVKDASEGSLRGLARAGIAPRFGQKEEGKQGSHSHSKASRPKGNRGILRNPRGPELGLQSGLFASCCFSTSCKEPDRATPGRGGSSCCLSSHWDARKIWKWFCIQCLNFPQFQPFFNKKKTSRNGLRAFMAGLAGCRACAASSFLLPLPSPQTTDFSRITQTP